MTVRHIAAQPKLASPRAGRPYGWRMVYMAVGEDNYQCGHEHRTANAASRCRATTNPHSETNK